VIEFPAVVFEAPDGRFVVTFPDLSECVAFASSLADAPHAAALALGALLAEMELVGETIPEPSSVEAVRDDPRNQDCRVILVTGFPRPPGAGVLGSD
jgi:predicted RNase H-like HicB family nuclease